MNTYKISLRGRVDVSEINLSSPHQMTPIQTEVASTLVTIFTDQSGLIGLIRHLHNLGFEIVSIVQQMERKKQ